MNTTSAIAVTEVKTPVTVTTVQNTDYSVQDISGSKPTKSPYTAEVPNVKYKPMQWTVEVSTYLPI